MGKGRAYTPGPWCDIGDQILAPEGQNDGYRIADVFGPDFPSNAALIAAAPDMFEALLTALPYIECAEEDEAYKPGVVAKVTARIRAALSKAEPTPSAEGGE